MIKIMFVMSNLYPGGAQRVFVNLINNLNHDKYLIKLVLLKQTSEEFLKKDLSITIDYIYLNKKARRALFSYRNEIKRFKPDIVFSTLGRVNILSYFSIFLMFLRPKLILRETIYRFKIKGFYNKLLKFAYKRADLIIALTEEIKDNLTRNYGIHPEHIKIFNNPINLNHITNKLSRTDKSIYSSKYKLISVGRLEKQKKQELLIQLII